MLIGDDSILKSLLMDFLSLSFVSKLRATLYALLDAEDVSTVKFCNFRSDVGYHCIKVYGSPFPLLVYGSHACSLNFMIDAILKGSGATLPVHGL